MSRDRDKLYERWLEEIDAELEGMPRDRLQMLYERAHLYLFGRPGRREKAVSQSDYHTAVRAAADRVRKRMVKKPKQAEARGWTINAIREEIVRSDGALKPGETHVEKAVRKALGKI
jgi:hypothetical protein